MGIPLISLQNCWTTCSTDVPISLCCLPTDFCLGYSPNYDPEVSKCAQPASKSFVFIHFTSKPLLTGGFREPTSGWVCSRPSALEFAPSRDTHLHHRWQLFTWQWCPQQGKEFLAILLSGEAFATPHKWCEICPRVWEGDSALEPRSITRAPATATGAAPEEALQEGDQKLPPTTWLVWVAAWIQLEAATEVMDVCGLLSFQLDVLWGSVYQNIWDLLICGYCAGFSSVCWLHRSHNNSGTILLKCWLNYLFFEPGCQGKAIHVQQAVENSFNAPTLTGQCSACLSIV